MWPEQERQTSGLQLNTGGTNLFMFGKRLLGGRGGSCTWGVPVGFGTVRVREGCLWFETGGPKERHGGALGRWW